MIEKKWNTVNINDPPFPNLNFPSDFSKRHLQKLLIFSMFQISEEIPCESLTILA